MGKQLISIAGSGPVLADSTVQANLLPTDGVGILMPNDLVVGDVFVLRAHGIISNVVTSPGTLELEVILGDVSVFSSGAMPLCVVAKTDVGWILELLMTCQTAGAAASFLTQGRWVSNSAIGSLATTAGGAGSIMLPYGSVPAVGSSFDSTTWNHIFLQGTWSVSDAANSIQVLGYVLEKIS